MTTARALYLDVANRRALGLDVLEAVTGAQRERTMDGAPTLTLDVHDPGARLIDSRVLTRAAIRALGTPEGRALRPVDLRYDGDWFRLVKATRSGATTTLTFEAREVAYLRQHTKPLAASRAASTRAEFIRRMVAEVGTSKGSKARPIPFWSPRTSLRRPIARATETAEPGRDASAKRDAAHAATSAKVKGHKATLEQRRNMATALGVARDLKAPSKAVLALFMACTQESEWKNLTGGHSSSVGILQLLDLHGPASIRRDVPRVIRLFLTKGFWGKGSAIGIAKANPGIDAAELAARVQGNARGAVDYRPWKREAQANIAALGGDDEGGGAEGGSYTTRYLFRRTKGEDSWTAAGRLAEEVARRRFISDGLFVYASDADLLALRARARLSPSHPAVVGLDYDLDYGKTVREASLEVLAADWRVPVGEPVMLEDAGPAAGKWLVWSVADALGSLTATVTLRQPQEDKPEPRSETAQRGDSSDSDADSDAESGSAERLYAEAKRISDAGGPYVYGGGHGPKLSGLNPKSGLDCSSSTSLALKRAGLFDPDTAWVSGDFTRYGQPGAGKHVTIYANGGHVWIRLKVPGKRGWRFDTSPYGDGGRGPRIRTTSRPTAGFVARHPPGL